jgi:hypothetical protein
LAQSAERERQARMLAEQELAQLRAQLAQGQKPGKKRT